MMARSKKPSAAPRQPAQADTPAAPATVAMEAQPLLTPKQVAARLGMSQRAVQQFCARGELRACRLGRGRRRTWRIDPADLEAFIRAGYEAAERRRDEGEPLLELKHFSL